MKEDIDDDFDTHKIESDLNDFDTKLQPQLPGSPLKKEDSDEETKEQILTEKNTYMLEKIHNMYTLIQGKGPHSLQINRRSH